MDDINIPELVEDLNSPDDGIRKKAAFRLQSTIGDPSFADQFEIAGGLTALRSLALNATGNTLAYSLASFSKLLEVLDQGWEYVDRRLIERVGIVDGDLMIQY
jgi:engulfment/cell motility protein 1